ncbi:MAG: protein kinase [Polyangiaceae bacterium]|jgi:serine/threonine-protein kinase
MTLRQGDAFDRYRIEASIGEGGMGTVYRAFDTKLRRSVALKLLRSDLLDPSDDPSRRNARLLREARAAAALNHANAIAIYDVGETEGTSFIAMELVDGRSLRACVGDVTLAMAERVRMLGDVARALGAAHERGLIHRDIKPENVMVRRDGAVKVLDFGIARGLDASPSTARPFALAGAGQASSDTVSSPLEALTRDSFLLGTPRYMAPEQLRGGPYDERVDQFSWGVLAYELLTGRLPWDVQGDLLKLIAAVQEDSPRSPRELDPAIPEQVERVVVRATAKDPEQRFVSMAELLEALEGKHAMPPEPSPRGEGATVKSQAQQVPSGRGRWLGVVVAGVAAIGLLSALAWQRLGSVSHPAPGPSAASSTPRTPPSGLHLQNVRRVTFTDRNEEFPSFAPDGSIVYAGTTDDGTRLLALDPTSGRTREVTHGPQPDIAPSVSPDGTRVAFVRFDESGIGTYVAPLDGSAPAHRIAPRNSRPAWSRDGRLVWIGHGADLEALDAETGAVVRTLTGPIGGHLPHALELADGSLVALYTMAPQSRSGGLTLTPPGGSMRWLLEADLEEASTLTPDGKHVIVVRVSTSGAPEVLDVPVDGSPVTTLTGTGIAASKGLDLSADGRHVAWSTSRPVPSFSQVDASGKLSTVLAEVESDDGSVAPLPEHEMAVVSTRSGVERPWLVDFTGKAPPRELNVPPGRAGEIAVSRDGKKFVVALVEKGLFIGDVRGDTPARQLTTEPSDSEPAFRFGDSEVMFMRHGTDGHVEVCGVPASGGDVTPRLGSGSGSPAPSPADDHVVYFEASRSSGVVPMVWDGRTGARRQLSPELPAGPYMTPRVSPDGKRVVILRAAKEMFEVDVATGKVLRTIRDADPGAMIASPAYASWGLFVLSIRWRGNLWLADVAP